LGIVCLSFNAFAQGQLGFPTNKEWIQHHHKDRFALQSIDFEKLLNRRDPKQIRRADFVNANFALTQVSELSVQGKWSQCLEKEFQESKKQLGLPADMDLKSLDYRAKLDELLRKTDVDSAVNAKFKDFINENQQSSLKALMEKKLGKEQAEKLFDLSSLRPIMMQNDGEELIQRRIDDRKATLSVLAEQITAQTAEADRLAIIAKQKSREKDPVVKGSRIKHVNEKLSAEIVKANSESEAAEKSLRELQGLSNALQYADKLDSAIFGMNKGGESVDQLEVLKKSLAMLSPEVNQIREKFRSINPKDMGLTKWQYFKAFFTGKVAADKNSVDLIKAVEGLSKQVEELRPSIMASAALGQRLKDGACGEKLEDEGQKDAPLKHINSPIE